jgi:hypothetical protein
MRKKLPGPGLFSATAGRPALAVVTLAAGSAIWLLVGPRPVTEQASPPAAVTPAAVHIESANAVPVPDMPRLVIINAEPSGGKPLQETPAEPRSASRAAPGNVEPLAPTPIEADQSPASPGPVIADAGPDSSTLPKVEGPVATASSRPTLLVSQPDAVVVALPDVSSAAVVATPASVEEKASAGTGPDTHPAPVAASDHAPASRPPTLTTARSWQHPAYQHRQTCHYAGGAPATRTAVARASRKVRATVAASRNNRRQLARSLQRKPKRVHVTVARPPLPPTRRVWPGDPRPTRYALRGR